MKFVTLNEAQTASLRELHKNGKSHRERQRAQAVLLNARGVTLDELAFIFECDRDTVSGWLDLWQAGGQPALADTPKSGRPVKLDAKAQALVLQAVESPTPNLKAVLMDKLKRGV
jgi:transposase